MAFARSSSALGDWNWYLPKWLEWIPQFNAEGQPPVPPPQSEAKPTSEAGRA